MLDEEKMRVLSVILLISVCLLLFYVVLEKSDLGLLGNQDTESGEASDKPSPSTSDQTEDSETDTANDGLYLDGTYTPGTLLGSFTA